MTNVLRNFIHNLNGDCEPATHPELDFIREYPSIKSWVDEYCEIIKDTFNPASEYKSKMLRSCVYKAIINELYDSADPNKNRPETVHHWQQDLEKLNTWLALKGY